MLATLTDNSKSRLLGLLKASHGSTVLELAAHMGISIPAARKHLCDLEVAGLIELSVEKPCGRGRPQHVYRLSHKGEGTFPKSYAGLCLDVLEHLQTLFGEGALLQVLSSREDKLFETWKPLLEGQLDLKSRLERLSELLTEAGYQASVCLCEKGNLYLEQRNCPSLEVARHFKQICGVEQTLYQRLLGVPVVRELQISNGAKLCRYRVG